MVTCEACGFTGPLGAKFCQQCGRRLGFAAANEAPTTFRYERKWISILFADVSRSLEIVARSDPEHAHQILTDATTLMQEAVNSHGGIVNRVAGDGIMAMFGAPAGAEDHAIRACAAALAMLERIADQNATEHDPKSYPIAIRVGIATGEVLVHPTVAFESIAYDATGEAVHRASRLEQAATPGHAVISEETYSQAMACIEVADLGFLPGKGSDAPMKAYGLVRLLAPRVPIRRRPGVNPSVFVDRVSELATLVALRDAAIGGRGAAVQITADPGVGKSRLVHEFAGGLCDATWTIYQCEAQRHRRTNFRTITDLLERILGLDYTRTGHSQVENAFDRLSVTLSMHDRQALLALIGTNEPDPAWIALEPRERRHRLDQALIRFLLALAERGPTLFLIEDAHWMDEESALLFERFFSSIATRHVLAIATSRGDYEVGSTTLSAHHEIRLEPLSPADAATLLNGHMRRGPGVASLAAQLVELTKGNPLFLEECLFSLLDIGAAIQVGDELVLAGRVSAVKVPRTLRGLLASRVDRLSGQEKDILEAAAVIGTIVSIDLLSQLILLEAPQIERTVRSLCRNGFLLQQPDSSLRYTFRHALVREAVYESIPLRRREIMHARVLHIVASWEGDHVEMLADHAMRARKFDLAAEYSRRAGNKAFQRDAKEEAVRFFNQGLEACGRCPDDMVKNRMYFDISIDLRNPLFQLGRIAELSRCLTNAAPSKLGLTDPSRLGRYYPYLGHHAWFQGDTVAALDAAQRTLSVAQSLRDDAMGARAKFQEGLVWVSQGRNTRAIETFSAVLDYLSTGTNEYRYGVNASLEVTTLYYVARAYADLGEEPSADYFAERAMAVAAKLQNPFASVFAYLGLGYCHLRAGRSKQATPLLKEALSISIAGEAPLMTPVAASYLAWSHVDNGAPQDGLSMAILSVEQAEEMGFKALHPLRLAILARARLSCKEVDTALRKGYEAQFLARQQQERSAEAFCLQVIGEALIARFGRNDEVVRLRLQDGLKLAEELELRPQAKEIRRLLVH